MTITKQITVEFEVSDSTGLNEAITIGINSAFTDDIQATVISIQDKETITVKEVTGHYGTGYMPVCKDAYIFSHLKSGSNMTSVFVDHDLKQIKALGYKIIKTK